jgi:hypothetical protein
MDAGTKEKTKNCVTKEAEREGNATFFGYG